MEPLKIAHLNDENTQKIQALEAELGNHVMAFEPGKQYASLSQAQLQKVQALESELGVTLLVYSD